MYKHLLDFFEELRGISVQIYLGGKLEFCGIVDDAFNDNSLLRYVVKNVVRSGSTHAIIYLDNKIEPLSESPKVEQMQLF